MLDYQRVDTGIFPQRNFVLLQAFKGENVRGRNTTLDIPVQGWWDYTKDKFLTGKIMDLVLCQFLILGSPCLQHPYFAQRNGWGDPNF